MRLATILRCSTLAALVAATTISLGFGRVPPTPAGAAETVTILVDDNWVCGPEYASPAPMCETVIDAGDTVRWDFTPATDVQAIVIGDLWDSGPMPRDGTYTAEFTFEQPGVYEYYSDIHPLVMTGRILVLGQPPLPGDTNCDETVNSIDAAFVLQYGAGLITSVPCQDNADTNEDGTINAIDAALILQYEAGLIDVFPQGKQDGDPAWGPEDALVTIVEFADFECSSCARFAFDTLPLLMENYGDQVRFVYRDFPDTETDDLKAAEAAQCAHDQGAFWEYHDLLLQNQSALDVNSLKAYAASLGLDSTTFNACLDSDEYLAEVMKDREDGEAAGVTSVPSFFVNGLLIRGAQPYSVFEAAIEAALAEIHSLGGG